MGALATDDGEQRDVVVELALRPRGDRRQHVVAQLPGAGVRAIHEVSNRAMPKSSPSGLRPSVTPSV